MAQRGGHSQELLHPKGALWVWCRLPLHALGFLRCSGPSDFPMQSPRRTPLVSGHHIQQDTPLSSAPPVTGMCWSEEVEGLTSPCVLVAAEFVALPMQQAAQGAAGFSLGRGQTSGLWTVCILSPLILLFSVASTFRIQLPLFLQQLVYVVYDVCLWSIVWCVDCTLFGSPPPPTLNPPRPDLFEPLCSLFLSRGWLVGCQQQTFLMRLC